MLSLPGVEQLPEVAALSLNSHSSIAALLCKDGRCLLLASQEGRAQLVSIAPHDSLESRVSCGSWPAA
jgi:hypothetical protein